MLVVEPRERGSAAEILGSPNLCVFVTSPSSCAACVASALPDRISDTGAASNAVAGAHTSAGPIAEGAAAGAFSTGEGRAMVEDPSSVPILTLPALDSLPVSTA